MGDVWQRSKYLCYCDCYFRKDHVQKQTAGFKHPASQHVLEKRSNKLYILMFTSLSAFTFNI